MLVHAALSASLLRSSRKLRALRRRQCSSIAGSDLIPPSRCLDRIHVAILWEARRQCPGLSSSAFEAGRLHPPAREERGFMRGLGRASTRKGLRYCTACAF